MRNKVDRIKAEMEK